jgi:hypothetical protein
MVKKEGHKHAVCKKKEFDDAQVSVAHAYDDDTVVVRVASVAEAPIIWGKPFVGPADPCRPSADPSVGPADPCRPSADPSVDLEGLYIDDDVVAVRVATVAELEYEPVSFWQAVPLDSPSFAWGALSSARIIEAEPVESVDPQAEVSSANPYQLIPLSYCMA